jgi:peptidoglycan/LPS O-acetylase OafA/YrhL
LRDLGLTASGGWGLAANVVLVAAVTAVLSTLSYRYVERPALARKRSWEQGRAPAPVPASAAAPSAPPATAPLR